MMKRSNFYLLILMIVAISEPCYNTQGEHAEKGARIIFHAVNGGRNGSEWSRNVFWPFHETNLRIRAKTGKLWIVTADNCHPTNIPCSAPSGVIKPNGNWAVKTPGQAQQMAVYTIELQ